MRDMIMITGGSGYIGSWVVKLLLERGYRIRLTVRNKLNVAKIQHLLDFEKQAPGILEIWEADLLKEGSFDEVAQGCRYILHMASPFIVQTKDPQAELITPALLGTRNVLDAASKSSTVIKVVLTSSVAAIYGDNIDMHHSGIESFNEAFYNTTSSLKHQPYSYSKTLAEKDAWKIQQGQLKWKLVVLNPAFVMGPPLTKTSNSESITLMRDFLTGKYRLGAPNLDFAFVDVRDVAEAHVLAIEKERVEGRIIIAETTTDLFSFSKMIGKIYGKKYPLPIMRAPKFLLYLIAPAFGLTRKFVRLNIGYKLKFDNTKSKEQLGITYRPLEETVKDMVDKMEELQIIT